MKNVYTFIALLLCGGAIAYTVFSEGPNHKESLRLVAHSTTDGEVALGNLQAQIESLKGIVSSGRSSLGHKKKLMDLLQTQMLFVGSFDELKTMAALTDMSSTVPLQIQLNISYLMQVHEFSKAEQELKKLKKYSKYDHSDTEISLMMNRGKDRAAALKRQKAAVEKSPRYSSLLKLAGLLSEDGQFSQALMAYENSLRAYKNTSPLAPAYAYFRMGVLVGEEMGQTEASVGFYKKALEFLPTYIGPRVHLAEILLDAGKPADAQSVLRPVAGGADPEISSTIAKVLLALGKMDEAANEVAKAKESYERLLLVYPFAFADHASEFYREQKSLRGKALDLAKINLRNRKSRRALRLVELAEDRLKGGSL